jgi:hypothetical protein
MRIDCIYTKAKLLGDFSRRKTFNDFVHNVELAGS